MASLEELEDLLAGVSRSLDRAAEQVRDLPLTPAKNLQKIGEAIALMSEIRTDVYDRRPDLVPEHLKKR